MKLRAAILLVLATIGLVVVVSPAQPAWACSCAHGPVEQDERAERTVTGTVTQVTDEGVRLTVDAVVKGDARVGETLGLRVNRSEVSCGYAFRVGARYQVNANNGATGLCVGVRPLPAASAPIPTSADPTPVVATPAVAEPAPEPTSRSWLAPGALLLVIAAGLVAVALRRRRSAR
ncbi:hypothetical protein [Catellatospora citrea]|uniref:MYXO-CTERM domain-containing protein n=1 Tax=Catellatospora citrea TaxID=53366 RepID=A0A8J3KI11_9ACTN|nr:hypothetical protein [Catellatospora citrea]RKE11966.1 hypothetical protein C8E86_6900 [Catellatospora citrea]GIG00397.1 hypothetical protein Cci01nite_54900 [Catellatospora citrea]